MTVMGDGGEPRTLTDTEWADAQETLAGPYLATVADRAEGDPQVDRAIALLERALAAPPDPERDKTLVRRAALVLLADPDAAGTAYRCRSCQGLYYGPPEPPDWNVAGADDWQCWLCIHAPKDAPAAIEAPAQPDGYAREHADVLVAVAAGEGADGRVCAALARRGLLTQDTDRWTLTESGCWALAVLTRAGQDVGPVAGT